MIPWVPEAFLAWFPMLHSRNKKIHPPTFFHEQTLYVSAGTKRETSLLERDMTTRTTARKHNLLETSSCWVQRFPKKYSLRVRKLSSNYMEMIKNNPTSGEIHSWASNLHLKKFGTNFWLRNFPNLQWLALRVSHHNLQSNHALLLASRFTLWTS